MSMLTLISKRSPARHLGGWRSIRRWALSCFVAACAVALPATVDQAEARRFGAMFSSAGKAAGSAGRAASRATRSSDEVARLKQVESRIDWGEVGKKGLEVVKTVIEKGASSGSSSSSSSPSSGKTAFSASVLDPIELEACVRETRWLDDADTAYTGKKAKLDEASQRIERLSNEIDAARNRVDRTSQHSVDAFNARIREHRQLVANYNDALLPDIRRDQDAFNSRVKQFNQYCQGKSYYDSDLAEVEAKIGFKLSN